MNSKLEQIRERIAAFYVSDEYDSDDVCKLLTILLALVDEVERINRKEPPAP